MTQQWSQQQAHALTTVGNWLKKGNKPYFQLAGYAGTGKTTLAKHLVESVDGAVYFAAFTGKAAHVLQKAGAHNVSTIHKLIYLPKEKSKQRLKDLENALQEAKQKGDLQGAKDLSELIAAETANISRPSFTLNLDSPLKTAKLLVVDEYSMINQAMGEDIMSFGCPVLALGDPAQLPPVFGEPYFNNKPDVLLTEIHRQAADNPIIHLASLVRKGEEIPDGLYGESLVVSQSKFRPPEFREGILNADQVLVGKNKTRTNFNSRIRELTGRSGMYPVAGDKLICLRNNNEVGLLNGQIWTATTDAILDTDLGSDYLSMGLVDEDGGMVGVLAHTAPFKGEAVDPYTRKEAEEFDYGYAMTVHKAQGSQWDNVLLYNEWGSTNKRQWLYTGITRAAQKITIVKAGQ